MARQHQSTYVTEPSTKIEFPLSTVTQESESDMLFNVTPRRILVGYLAHDDQCDSPMDDEGNGKVYTRHRHSSEEDKKIFRDALGLNEDWQPDYENWITWPDLLAKANSKINESYNGIGGNAVYRAALKACQNDWEWNEDRDHSEPMRFIRECLESIDEREVLELVIPVEPLYQELWNEYKKKGMIGNPYAVVLDVYEHSGISYSLQGEGLQCRWDTAPASAIWIPDQCALDNFLNKELPYVQNYAMAENYSRSCIEEYNDWCNGNCWSLFIDYYDRSTNTVESVEETHRLIGRKTAKTELLEAFNSNL